MEMIIGLCHPGSGVGNQLFRIVQARVLALDKGFEYGIAGRENFKASSFMNMDFGKDVPFGAHVEMPAGKLVVETDSPLFEEKTSYYNPEVNFVEDNTVIDGEWQSTQYFEHRLGEIDEWLKVEPLSRPHDTCVIGFRGGEFALFPELFLREDYWKEAIKLMREQGVKNFEVHTDDPDLASNVFPDYPIIHDVGINWRSMRYAQYAIIANSSFYILPRLLRQTFYPSLQGEASMKPITIAPRYWARHNTKEWSMPQNYYKSFQYI